MHRSRGTIARIAALATTMFTVRTSRAESSPSSGFPPPRDALILDGWLGASLEPIVDGHPQRSFGVGMTALYRHAWLEVGFAPSVGTEFFGAGYFRGTILAGTAVNPADWFQVDLLGEFGFEYVSELGSGLFEKVTEGGSVTLPYYGVRVGASFLEGRSHRFVVGGWFAPGFSGHATVNATISGLFGDSTRQTHDVGGFTFTAGLRLGGVIRLGD